MKQILLVLMALFLVGFAGVPGTCSTTPAAMAAVIEPDFSFGTVAEGKELTHTFMVENRGDAKLVITKVETG